MRIPYCVDAVAASRYHGHERIIRARKSSSPTIFVERPCESRPMIRSGPSFGHTVFSISRNRPPALFSMRNNSRKSDGRAAACSVSGS